jgi:2,4-dienoyl-CoA reductase-like NADH-dependent reductase (Old Yellow Enzyme family)
VSLDPLFRPFRLKSLELKNRIAMAPMTRSFAPGGVPTPDFADYYARRAAAEVGLIISQGAVIERPGSANDPLVPRFWGESALRAWKQVLAAVHAAGGVMAVQLWHVGAAPGAADFVPAEPYESPSGLSAPEKPLGRALSESEVADVIAAYAGAAGEARRMGFDAVELHGAHGYLIDQFFWPGSNLRTDIWGGPGIGERTRFAAELLKAVRAEVGEDFPICIRLSQWKLQDFKARIAATPGEMETWLTPLADAGADLFHCSQRRFWQPEFEGSDLNFAGWAKKLTGKPSMTVGSVGLSADLMSGKLAHPAPLEDLLARLEREEFDLVAVGRALLSDPEWLVKIRDGRSAELKDYTLEALNVLY